MKKLLVLLIMLNIQTFGYENTELLNNNDFSTTSIIISPIGKGN